ncbi:hypothetical protein CHS0354_021235 [Potamilus streckersoni]|uniref:Integral membrane protein 2 n=1 Tax=Potamilus streckersoni TaxID=2493646 RepID=A0AAE0VQ05_9BIVA|nr:hypothetical protein CHS0354_021235 [Potamilus streckersoni]
MTIYKGNLQKNGDKEKRGEFEVVIQPLTGKKKKVVASPPAQAPILFTPARRSRTCFNLCLILIGLLVLAGGVVGAVFLYKHLTMKHHVHQEHVKIPIHKTAALKSETTQIHSAFSLEEDVEIDIESNTEKLQVPDFDDCRSSLVMHDFYSNYTAIVDRKDRECFVMKLDRKISPPKNFIDLLYKYKTGYYMPDIKEVREDYRIVTPELKDLAFFGPFIKFECQNYSTYMMEKLDQEQVFTIEFQFKTYGYSDMKSLIKDRIFK